MKHLLSVIAIALFFVFAVASKVNKMHTGAMNYDVPPEAERTSYVVMKDGTRIEGEDFKRKSPMIGKDYITFDGKKIPTKDTKGYMLNGIYYARLGGHFMKRIVHGKINVYYSQHWDVSTNSATGKTTSSMVTYHYYQIGDDGDIKPIAGRKELKKILAGCDKAVSMIDRSYGKLRRAVRKNKNYVNQAFEIYNNGCK